MLQITITDLTLSRQAHQQAASITPPKIIPPPAPMRAKFFIHTLPNPTADLFRVLYHEIGHEWGWYEQKLNSDHRLQARLSHPQNHFLILSDHANLLQNPAEIMGFIELDWRIQARPNIFLFGLRSACQGQKLGGFFLNHALNYLFDDPETQRITVDTCTLDHPSALGLYQRLGFERVGIREKQLDFDPKAERFNHINALNDHRVD